MGTLGMNRTVSKAGLERGAGVTAKHEGDATQPRRLGHPQSATREARRWTSYLSMAVHI